MRDIDGLIAARRSGPPSHPRTQPGRHARGRGDRPEAARPRTGRPLPVRRRPADRHRAAPERPAAAVRPRAFAARAVRASGGGATPAFRGACSPRASSGWRSGWAASHTARPKRTARTEAVEQARDDAHGARHDPARPHPARRPEGARARRAIARPNCSRPTDCPDDPNWQKRDRRAAAARGRARRAGRRSRRTDGPAGAGEVAEPRRRAGSRSGARLAAEAWKLNAAARACFPADAVPPCSTDRPR